MMNRQRMNLANRLCTRMSSSAVLSALLFLSPAIAQKPSSDPEKLPEMQLTNAGLIAIDEPKGWVRSQGPGLAFFVPDGEDSNTAQAWIYISGSPVGPGEEDKDAEAYIQSDIAGFKKRFPAGVAQKSESLLLPLAKASVTVMTFRSGEERNAFEQVVYLPEAGRVLTLTLSAKTAESFQKSIETFHGFAKSYRGSIVMETPDEKQ